MKTIILLFLASFLLSCKTVESKPEKLEVILYVVPMPPVIPQPLYEDDALQDF